MKIWLRIPSFIIAIVSLVPTLLYAQGSTPTPPNTPSASDPYAFKREGIFDCGGAPQRGVTSAGGGAYVPVADATVEQNTGWILNNTDILVYKECVLRQVIIRIRESVASAFAKRAGIAIQTGRGGNPQYVVLQGQEMLQNADDPAFLSILQDRTLGNLNPALQGVVKRALALNYEVRTRAPQKILTCPYKGDLNLMLQGKPEDENVWSAVLAAGSPACSPLLAFYSAENLAGSRISQCEQYLQDQWNWGHGYYPLTDDPNNPCRAKTLTPAVNVQQSFQTILDSPVRQLESANDIGQMIGALYAGLTTQIISDNRGLAGLTQGIGGRPSYLDQVAAESSQGLRNAALNVAIQVLNAARKVEAAYFQAVNAIATTLIQTAAQLHSAENQCWNLIIPKVCTSPLSPQNECTDGSGNTYKVATSTAGFANAVIASQITPLVAPTTDKITASQNALRLIDQLIQGVTNTASLDAQRLALQQLDSLVAQRLLHVQPDVSSVTRQLTDVRATMSTLVTDTVQKWADDPSPATGWCNINNPAVVQAWKDRWKKP